MCVVGDYNNLLSQEEKISGSSYPQWLIDGFQETITDCDLVDLEMNGYPFTWERGRGTEAWTKVKLYRATVNCL